MNFGVILRSCLFAAVQFLLTPPFTFIALLSFPLEPVTRYRIISIWARLIVLAAEVICGIRPEDIHDRAFVRLEVRSQVIDGRVDVTEMMGNERFLHVIINGQKLLARVDPRTRARAGQDVSLLLEAVEVLSGLPGIIQARLHGDQAQVIVAGEWTPESLSTHLSTRGLTISGIETVEPTLEDVFTLLAHQ